ncbi:hypothetical protein BGZ80_001199 [Entomortierella chlamydospora]|uniref:Exportin-5 C-terminal domain-containing protein n=1 Tax=Entomortierella chlamydospora TaxID=101097 RepID=A0A9P6N1T7_9FUNG|nr:hypothetical protein BGZ80_001199 [Entomortierella chlamydospora]
MSQYCEGLKRDPLGPLYGYYLAHKDNNQPDVVRHFGLGLMEEAVRYRWSDGTLTPEVKAQIRLNVMSLAIDETGREMALLILRSLCEDVCIYDDAVAGLRMKDLRAGLLVIMASETVLKEHYPDGVKGHKNEVTLMVGESGNDGWTVRLATLLQDLLPRCQTETRVLTDEKIAVAALKALASSLDWIIISSISSVPIVPLVCHSLLSPSEKIRLAGAECYDVIASRNMTEAEREKIIWPLLDDGGIDLISKAYLTYSEQILQGEAYEFIQKLVQATVNLGEQQLCAKRNAHEPAVQSFIPSLLGLYSGHLAKDSKNRWKTDPVYRHFASLDFDSTVEFQDRALQIFQRAVDVIRLGVPVMPLDAFIWVANRVAEVLKINFTPDSNVKETTQYKSFDGTLTLMEVTISSLSDTISDSSHEQSGQVVNAMNSLLSILIEYDSKLFKAVEYPIPDKTAKDDTRVGDRAAITLVKFGRAIPDTLYPIYGEIESAIQQLIVRNVIPQGLRKTLESFLLVIAFNSTMPLDRVMIFNKVTQPVLADFQSSELQEALSDPRKFMAFIGVGELSDASKRSPSPQEIDTLKGIITQRRAKLSRSIETIHTFMKETINIDDNQTLDLWSSNLDSILPNLFSTIRCLNAICDEKLWVDLSPELSRLRILSPEEKISMVTGKAVPITASTAPGSLGVAKLVSDLKIWLAVLRDQSYRVLTQISLLGPAFYSRPSLQITLEQSLFDHVDCLSNRQLRLLIDHAVQPIVVNCPECFMDSVLSHLLMVLFPYLDQRLLNDWRLASEEGLQMDEKDDLEDLDVTDEIVKEIMLRDLTRYVAGFVFSILDYGKQKPAHQATAAYSYGQAAGGVDTTAIARKEITPLALFILSREATAQSVIPLICHILTFKDTRACTRSAETAQRVLTALVQNYPGSKVIIGAFSTMVLQAAMEALRDPYHQEGQEKLIQLITEVYIEVRAFDEAPKHVFQQSLGADSHRLEAFEQELSVTTVNKTKLALVRNFLQSIIGVAKSEWFKQKELGDKPTPSRTIAGKYERPSQSALDSKEHEDIGDGLASLFDE